MSLEDELWCLGISDIERATIGEMMGKAPNMVPNENGLYSTAQGDLSALELFNAIKGLLYRFAEEVALENINVSRSAH
jgi:hypothetical protein